MEDHDSSSSTGLVIGMIVGGVIVLVLAVVFVGGFFFMGRRAAPPMMPPPAAEEFADVAMEAEKGAKGGPLVEDGPPWPNPKRVAEQNQKILGIWTATGFKDGRTETWEVRADETMDVTTQRKGQADEVMKGKYELLVELGGPGVSIRYEKAKGGRTAWSLRYLDDDRFVVVPTVTASIDGVAVKNPDDDVQYHRKRAEKKP